MEDKVIIEQFVYFLSKNGYPHLRLERFPDEENRNTPDVDAIAGDFAIEHTSIDTVTNQRRDADYLKRIISELKNNFSSTLPFRLRLVIPYEAIKPNQNFSKIREALQLWLTTVVHTFPDGWHEVSEQINIPFRFFIDKRSDRPPGLFFARSKPQMDSLPERLPAQLNRKVKKLVSYKTKGKNTMLLVESGDIALMNEDKMLEYIDKALGKEILKDIDQIWCADSSISDLPEDVEFRNLTEMLRVK